MSWHGILAAEWTGFRERYFAYLVMGCDGDDAANLAMEDLHREALEQFIAETEHFTPEDQEVVRLRRRCEQLDSEAEELYDDKRRLHAALARGPQVCPLGCGWRGSRRLFWSPDEDDIHRFLDRVGRDLADHLIREHNATVATVALLGSGTPTCVSGPSCSRKGSPA